MTALMTGAARPRWKEFGRRSRQNLDSEEGKDPVQVPQSVTVAWLLWTTVSW